MGRTYLQASDHEDTRYHQLLVCWKLQFINHAQRHAQDDNVKTHVCAGDTLEIGAEINALVRKEVVGGPVA